MSVNLGVHIGVYQPCPHILVHLCVNFRAYWHEHKSGHRWGVIQRLGWDVWAL